MSDQVTSLNQPKSTDSVSENKPFVPVSASGLDIIHSALKKPLNAAQNKQQVIDSFDVEEKAYGLHNCPRQLMTGLCAMLNASAEEGLMAEAITEFQAKQPSIGLGYEGTGFGVTQDNTKEPIQQPRFK